MNVPPKSEADRARIRHKGHRGRGGEGCPALRARAPPQSPPMEGLPGLPCLLPLPFDCLRVLLAPWREQCRQAWGPLSRGWAPGRACPVACALLVKRPDPSWLLSFLPQACLCPSSPSVFPKCPCPPSLKGPSQRSFSFKGCIALSHS